MQPAQPVDREIQGTLAQVEMRQNGWHRFHIMEASMQYPTKVDTKRPELIQQAMSLMGQPIAAQIREQESASINPNSGRPYINRHINAIAPAGYAPGVMPTTGAPTPQQWQQQQQGQQMPVQPGAQQQYVPQQQGQSYPDYPQPPMQPQPQAPQQAPVQPQQGFQPGLQGMEREIAIQRQTASKVAAAMLESLPPEQQTMQGLVAVCEAWMAYYTYGPLRFGVTPFSSPQESQNTPARDDWASRGQTANDGAGDTGICLDCGFAGGQHAVGCPRGIPVG